MTFAVFQNVSIKLHTLAIGNKQENPISCHKFKIKKSEI